MRRTPQTHAPCTCAQAAPSPHRDGYSGPSCSRPPCRRRAAEAGTVVGTFRAGDPPEESGYWIFRGTPEGMSVADRDFVTTEDAGWPVAGATRGAKERRGGSPGPQDRRAAR
ncbi:hypothetical protein CXR04_05750 [Streptomyces sp. CMB-StM0423]|nr:hypothetical protein CXR04_05750 [Streptomyces sp. CMB-StM0423]